jgi:predicted DCC family thiol-disulfide oxidoreductase YuxK
MNSDIVFFDGVCNLCSSSVQFIIRHDKHSRFRFASLQSDFAASELKNAKLKYLDSIVLKTHGKVYTRSTAVLRIASKLSFPVNLLVIFLVIPAFIRNLVYQFIARNRYRWFGKKDTCWLPTPELRSRFID